MQYLLGNVQRLSSRSGPMPLFVYVCRGHISTTISIIIRTIMKHIHVNHISLVQPCRCTMKRPEPRQAVMYRQLQE